MISNSVNLTTGSNNSSVTLARVGATPLSPECIGKLLPAVKTPCLLLQDIEKRGGKHKREKCPKDQNWSTQPKLQGGLDGLSVGACALGNTRREGEKARKCGAVSV